MPPHRAPDADHAAQQRGNDGGYRHQRQGRADVRTDGGQHADAVAIGRAPIAAHHAQQPVAVLDEKGTVQPHAARQAVDILLRHVRRLRQLRQRAARRQVQDAEAYQRNQQQQHQGLTTALEQILSHLKAPARQLAQYQLRMFQQLDELLMLFS
ncbi:hypothetical protein D3C71_1666750 [compost metagenome]